MGEKISRRSALGRIGGAALGASLAGISGIGLLAKAVAAETEGGAGVLAQIACGTFCQYGCKYKYDQDGDGHFNDCPALDHDCDAQFACTGSTNPKTQVYCHSTSGGQPRFTCQNAGGGDTAYWCLVQEFHCGDTGAGFAGSERFECTDGPGAPDFICDDGGLDRTFWCYVGGAGATRFHCYGQYVVCA
jgi:hypothetical protein